MVAHINEDLVAALKGVGRMTYRIIIRCGLKHSDKESCLLGCQLVRSGVEISLCRCLDAKGVVTEVHGIGIHGEDSILTVDKLQLDGYNPFLTLIDDKAYTRDTSEEPLRVATAHLEEVLGQLLCDSRGSTGSIVSHGILHSASDTLEVDAMMLIEALILGVYKRVPEGWCDLVIPHRYSVLLKITAKKHTVRAEHLTAGILRRGHYLIEARRLTKEPKEVDVDHSKIEEQEDDKRRQAHRNLGVPFASSIEIGVPWEESYESFPY